MNNRTLFLKGIKNGFPIFLGYFAVSFTFGISAVGVGIKPLQTVLISAANLTSAGQFAAITVISSSLSYFELALTQLVINLRYALMSSSLSQKFSQNTGIFHRLLISFGNTDEVFGVLSMYDGYPPPVYCYGVILTAYPGWVLGTLLGAFSGNILPERILNALGIALYGMFIAIILPEARKNKFIALIIFVSMCLSNLFTFTPVLKDISSGFRIIILTVLIASVAAIIRPVEDKKEENK